MTGMLMLSVPLISHPVAMAEKTGTQRETDNSYILNNDTKKSDKTPCQVTARFNIPSGFGLNAYMDIMHDDGTTYRILTTDDSGYTDFAFVKAGHYIVKSYGIVDDKKNQYGFTITQDDFNVDKSDNSVITLDATIDDYDGIAQTIAERTGKAKQTLDTQESTDVPGDKLFKTNYKGISINTSGTLYYDTKSNSETCTANVYGNATGTYKLFIEITKGGVVGEAEFKLSLDGGNSFIGTDITSDEYDLSGYGLKISFTTKQDTDELKKGDTFEAFTPETFAVVASDSSNTNLVIAGHPKEKYQVLVNILSTGKRGVAKYSLSLDNGNSLAKIDTIPKNGVLKFGSLTYYFSDGEFTKDTTFTSEVKPNEEEVSYIPVIILLSCVCALFIAVGIWLLLQKEKAVDYKIRIWKDRQDAEKYNQFAQKGR